MIKKNIDKVRAGQRIRFDIVSKEKNIYIAYYNKENDMTIIKTDSEGNIIQKMNLPENAGRDSHHAVNLGIDPNGFIHISGNIHKDPLKYYRSKKPYDISEFDNIHAMIGKDEESCTYPVFFENSEGQLYFRYRTGKAGNGNVYLNKYDHNSEKRLRVTDTPMLDGKGIMNAYVGDFVLGSDEFFHTHRVWRNNPKCETNHTLEYAKTKNFINWFTADNKEIQLPILKGMGDIADPVKIEQGMLNGSIQVGFDAEDCPVISYHKFDSQGYTQIYNARFEKNKRKIYQTSNWKYRRFFEGGGTIELEIDVFPVESKDGKLYQKFKHKKYGIGIRELDSDTLKIKRELEIDKEILEIIIPNISERVVHINPISLTPQYAIRWETYPPNRDKKREGINMENLSSDLILIINERGKFL